MVAKDLVWTIVVVTCRTKRNFWSKEWRGQWEAAERGEQMWSM